MNSHKNLYFWRSKNYSYATGNFSFKFDSEITPKIKSISPKNGLSGILAIDGSGFGTDLSKIKKKINYAKIFNNNFKKGKVTVNIGEQDCSIQSVTDNQILCELKEHSAGSYPVVVKLNNQGNSNNDQLFTYDLIISSLSHTEGY